MWFNALVRIDNALSAYVPTDLGNEKIIKTPNFL